MTADLRRRLTVSDIRWVVHHVSSIRIAIASALILAGVFAGGTVHGKHSEAPAAARAVALAWRPSAAGPVLCC
jgi:hypothetical protein